MGTNVEQGRVETPAEEGLSGWACTNGAGRLADGDDESTLSRFPLSHADHPACGVAGIVT